MTSLLRLCGVAMVGAVAALMLKRHHSGQAAATATVALLLLLTSVLSRYGEAIFTLRALLSGSGFADYGTLMLKSLGIGLTVKITSDVCRDMGEESLAGALELAGRLEILLLCLPLMEEMLSLIREVMG
jgi:stage III sporulation protein AD